MPEKKQTFEEARESIILGLSGQEQQAYFESIIEKLKAESVIVNNIK
jgi:hypothetical protein